MSLYLSRLEIPLEYLLRHKLTDDYAIHQLVYRMCLAPDQNRDFLYYVAHTPYGGVQIQIQSRRIPNDSGIGRLSTKEIPESFFSFNRYSFLVRIRPVCKAEGKVTRVLYRTEEIIGWLCKRGDMLGIRFLQETMDKQRADELSFKDKGRHITITYADVTGVLEVVDRSKFLDAVGNGIGGSKGFGLGLLQLKPVK